jgi:hypothetical protein
MGVNLYDQPGKPFGYAWLEERTRIEDHVLRRMGYALPVSDMRVRFRVDRIQERLHKYDTTFADRSREWFEQQRQRPVQHALMLTTEQLEHIVSLWSDANDPMSREIAAICNDCLR